MQNKPNLVRRRRIAKFCKQMDYENISDWTIGQSKPNSNPIKPNSRKAKMNVNLYVIEDYENEPDSGPKKQTQTNPIQTLPWA